MLKKKIGHIISGSLDEGLLMRIDASTNPETIKNGKEEIVMVERAIAEITRSTITILLF